MKTGTKRERDLTEQLQNAIDENKSDQEKVQMEADLGDRFILKKAL